MTRSTRVFALALLAILVWAAPAFADTEVVIRVTAPGGGTAEATVTLTPEQGGQAYSCQTSSGTCRIHNVPAGRFVVTARPSGQGESPLPRVVPIPPNTEVTVSVALR